MSIKLQTGENIIKEGVANHFKGIESVGGRLFLTNQRIYFISHNLNIQNHELSIPLDQILEVGKRNTLGIVPNGMFINLKTGESEKFVIWGRNDWISKIRINIS